MEESWFRWERQVSIHLLFPTLEVFYQPLGRYSGVSAPTMILIFKNGLVTWCIKENEFIEYGEKLLRFFSIHGGVGESFLGKVIELSKGADIRDQFAQRLNMMGFSPLEGFNVEIMNRGRENQEVLVVFHKEDEDKRFEFRETISQDILQTIQKSK